MRRPIRRRFAPPRPQHRINHMIRVPQIRVIGPEGEQLGVMSSDDARRMAREYELDLVEISPTASPPVCQIMDYGKFKYEQKKKQNESKKKQHNFTVKEVRVRPKTGDHDIEVKVKRARNFLESGDKVQLTVLFRGREVVHSDIGIRILEEIAQELSEIAKVERTPRLEGKRMHMILTPIKRPQGGGGGGGGGAQGGGGGAPRGPDDRN